MHELPRIKIELECMRSTLHAALTEREVRMDAFFKDALNRLLTDEAIQQMVDAQVVSEVKHIIADHVRRGVQRYYATGPGREVMAKAVLEAVAADAKKTLDAVEQERLVERTYGTHAD